MRILAFICVFTICCSLTCGADETFVNQGYWTFSYDKESGLWNSLRWKDRVICENPERKVPFERLGPGWNASTPTFIGESWNEKTGELILNYHYNSFKVNEIIDFKALGRNNCIGLKLSFEYMPDASIAEPVKFQDPFLNIPLPKEGDFLFPVTMNLSSSTNEGEGNLASLKAGVEKYGAPGIAPLLICQGSETLIFMPDGRRESTAISFTVGEKSICVKNTAHAGGWAYPGEPQTIGPFYIEVFQGDHDKALKEGVWSLYDAIGIKVPPNIPDWCRDAVLYSFHPGGSVGSDWKDIGGFAPSRDVLLPQLAKIGFNALWILPVEDQPSPYWPRDYYKLDSSLGSEAEYSSLVENAHQLGMTVLQDNVPHGGTPAFAAMRGNKPWELVFDQNGDAFSYWCFDFGNPEWQRHIAGVIEYNMKKYKIDGYRIDVPGGSRSPNWRKKDFPSIAKTPKNIPEEWWKKELAAVGGKLPPLPYGRATDACRRGGLGMLRTIRDTVRQCNPISGAILGEVQYVPYMQEADIIYDVDFCHSIISKMGREISDNFAKKLAKRLEEQKYAEPRDTLRLRYVESHDSMRARSWLGVDATKALTAITMFIHGVPMIHQDSDVGESIFLKKLIEIRKALPEFRGGDAEYFVAEPETVFACFRNKGDLASIALVNLSPNPAEMTLALPENLATKVKMPFNAWGCKNGSILASGLSLKDAPLELFLGPWDYEIVAFRPSSAPCPVKAEATSIAQKRVSPDGKVDIVESKDSFDVETPEYKFSINKSDGLPKLFSDANGNSLLENAKLVSNSPFENDLQPIGSSAVYSVSIDNGTPKLSVSGIFVLGMGSFDFTYVFLKDAVKINATVKGRNGATRFGLAFPFKEAERWQISTAEGVLDDFYAPRHLNGVASANGSIYYRPQGSPVLWQARSNPLDPGRPVLRVQNHSSGIEIAMENLLAGGLDNVMLADSLGKDVSLHAILFWRDNDKWERPINDRRENFTAVLRVAPEPLSVLKERHIFKAGDCTIENLSYGWKISTPRYSVVLERTGGSIVSLGCAGKIPVLCNNALSLYTDKGFAKSSAAASNDVETGVRIWQQGKALHMRFSGMLRGVGRHALLRPPIWFSNDYIFDESSLKLSWGVMCDKPQANNVFLAWSAKIPDAAHFEALKNGIRVSTGNFNTALRSGTGPALPDTLKILNEKEKAIVSLSSISYPQEFSGPSVFVQEDKLFIALFSGNTQNIQAGKWYQCSMSITPF